MLRHLAFIFCLVVGLTPVAIAQEYEFVTIDVPDTFAMGAMNTDARGINNAGQIVGLYEVVDSPNGHRTVHSFLRSADGTYANIDLPGDERTYASKINNTGQIVGSFAFVSAFVRSADGGITIIDVPGADAGAVNANGINDAGQIVGTYGVGLTSHGFLRSVDGSNFTTIDVPGGSLTHASGINNTGEIVGDFRVDDGPVHGFLRSADGRSFTTIDVPGAFVTIIHDINDAGWMAGEFNIGSALTLGPTQGFMRSPDGQFITVDVPGASATYVFGINAGQIVGGYVTDQFHGFLVRPVQ